jgi:TolB protein
MRVSRLPLVPLLLLLLVALAACDGGVGPTEAPEPTLDPTEVPTEVPAVDPSDFVNVIAYTQMTDSGPEIHAVYLSPDNPEVWSITDTPGAAVLPRWSPNLAYLGFLYYEPDAEDVDFWVADIAADGVTRPVTTGGVAGVEAYTWSPDSRHVAYDAPQPDGSERDVFVLDMASGERTNLTDGSESWDSDPSWSPDGQRLAFSSDRDIDGEPALNNIWTMANDGSGLVNLTQSVWEDLSPSWSPDGDVIAFYRWSLAEPEEGGPAGLWIVSAEGGEERLVAELPGLAGPGYDPPAWSPDGELIAFQYGPQEDADVYVVPVAGGEPKRIGEPLGHDFAISWSPDSSFVLFCHTLQQDLMLYMAAPDGRLVESLLGVGGNCYGEWAPTGP